QLNEVVGTDRLPSFQDRHRLPYIHCVLKEVLQWGTPVPMTPPHRLMQDDQYRGYDLPEGSFVSLRMSTPSAILHDETLYIDQLKFSPKRFEHAKAEDGAQRALETVMLTRHLPHPALRHCPGLHFANQSLFLASAWILACFDIAPRKGVDGKPLLPPLEFAVGAFRCAARSLGAGR
ncbi:cytochrome P450, partial [Trametes punicea]